MKLYYILIKNKFLKAYKCWSAFCQNLYTYTISIATTHATSLTFLYGCLLLTFGLTQLSHANNGGPAYNPAEIRGAVQLLFNLIEGAFGALVMVVAGIGAIISSAFGAYRAAVSLIVVATGSFILRSLVSLFFGSFDNSDITSIQRITSSPQGEAISSPADWDIP
jgi:hypothetical protein